MGTTTTETTLDVREIDGPPFGRISDTLDALEASERLRLIAGFEPVPLYGMLDERGLSFETERSGENEWHVLIERP
ncbi:DUF2249 domain-containing protein [Natronococcus roseus]|uniref:DUF2249 domain-containing protein n=1 Tax=Natronococcus roseus TaxID=1052014 RepID=UPI00374D22E1